MKVAAAVLLFALASYGCTTAPMSETDRVIAESQRQSELTERAFNRMIERSRQSGKPITISPKAWRRSRSVMNTRPKRSLTERVADPFGWGHDHTHSHRPASGIYIDGGSYLIGPDFWCTKSGNVVVCN